MSDIGGTIFHEKLADGSLPQRKQMSFVPNRARLGDFSFRRTSRRRRNIGRRP
jgi:hypothetical protein